MKVVILQIISIILQSIISTYLYLTLSKIIGNLQSFKKNQILLSFISTLFNVILSIFIKDYLGIPLLNTIISNLIFFLIIKYIYGINTLKAILTTVIGFVIIVFTEFMALSLAMLVLNENLQNIASGINLSIVTIIIQFIIIYFLMKITEIVRKKVNCTNIKNEYLNKKSIILFSVLVLFFIVPQLALYILNYKTYPAYNIIINSLQIIVICAILFIFFKQCAEKEKTESDLNNTKIHNRTMIGMVDGVRTIKHDYNNIIQAMNGYIATKQYDKLQNHINMVMEECNLINNLSTIDPKIFNEPAIYGIVGSKFFLAQEKDIPMELDVTTNIKDISFDMPLLSRILGIFLDNAIEATSKTENSFIRLEMRFDKKKCADIIRVYNTYDQKVQINLQDIYEKGFSTKKVKSGIGLWEVKKIVTKNKHSQVFATIEHGKFVQNLIIERI